MVYTVTFNPSLDYVINVKNLSEEDINRAESEELYYGGKGINVSVILSRLKIPTTALGFAGGFTGKKLCEMLTADGISNDFVFLDKGDTRINVMIKQGGDLDINAAGPHIPQEKLTKLYEKLKNLKNGDWLVLAGSIPNSLSDDIYGNILSFVSDKSIFTAVDATGSLLLNTLKHKPFIIKPNHHELGKIFGKKLTETDEIIVYAKKLQNMGAKNVLVSCGEDGAVLVNENGKIYIADAVKGTLLSSVGCGDSMVAGFIAGYIKNEDYSEALKLSVASSAATAFSKSLATAEEIKNIFDKI